MRGHSVMAAGLLLLAGCLGAAAEAAGSGEPLGLADCVRLALQNHSDVAISRRSEDSARMALVRARSGYLPKLVVEGSAFTWTSHETPTSTATGTALAISQTLWDGGYREAGVSGAEATLAAEQALSARTVQATTYAVSSAYYELLRAQDQQKVQQANVAYAEGLRDQAQARAKVGDAAPIDVLPLEAQVAGARVSLIAARNTTRTRAIGLLAAMGMPSTEAIAISGLPEEPAAPARTLAQCIDAAIVGRPDLAEARASVAVAHASTRSAAVALLPVPSVSVQALRRLTGPSASDTAAVVGSISYDLFDAGANRAAHRQARDAEEIARLRARQVELDIRAEVQEAYLAVESARERLDAAGASLRSAEANYQAQKSRYGEGTGTPIDLLNAETQLVGAQGDQVQARYDLFSAQARLLFAVGQ